MLGFRLEAMSTNLVSKERLMSSLSSEPLTTFIGVNGVAELYCDRIIIYRKGLLSHLSLTFPGNSRTISLHQLDRITLFPGALLMNGVIRLITEDENIWLFFDPSAYPLALKMKNAVEDLLSRQKVFPDLRETLYRP
jgi:hypothetical protein